MKKKVGFFLFLLVAAALTVFFTSYATLDRYEEKINKEKEAFDIPINPPYDYRNVYKIIDLFKESDPKACAKLFDAALENNFECEECRNSLYRFGGVRSVKAVEFDLNDDGVNEVIGIIKGVLYNSRDCLSLLVLNKDGKINLATLYDETHPIFIMGNRGKGNYRDIITYTPREMPRIDIFTPQDYDLTKQERRKEEWKEFWTRKTRLTLRRTWREISRPLRLL